MRQSRPNFEGWGLEAPEGLLRMGAWRVRLARMLVEEAHHSMLYGSTYWAVWCLRSAESSLAMALTESVPTVRPSGAAREV